MADQRGFVCSLLSGSNTQCCHASPRSALVRSGPLWACVCPHIGVLVPKFREKCIIAWEREARPCPPSHALFYRQDYTVGIETKPLFIDFLFCLCPFRRPLHDTEIPTCSTSVAQIKPAQVLCLPIKGGRSFNMINLSVPILSY